ncbi:Na+/H+ antiporter NhaC family protein [Desulfopila aestuarii]|uniref:Transporter, NhaC family n=1 Tax=Desulfopila aestuarii DSM 18488 TaxID=1121416 RepID=A0A1M7YII6_9BACT|nr:Na+/H+ antiporter NhaC family protein [Desulfopila aestuarii]SHO52396.1 transporter, NhaC family [Desulfopila aestuarii DSM 18488]
MSTIISAGPSISNSLEGKPALQRVITEYFGLFCLFLLVGYFVPDDETALGAFSALPSLFLLAFIFYTKRILEGLTLAALLAFIMADKTAFFTPLNETLTEVLTDGDTQWLFIVCGLMGSIIALIEKAGGAQAFGAWVAKRAKTRKSTLLWTWILGVVIFIDDYLNCLTVGSCMAPITDKHKVSREKLAYIVDSTAAPVCVLIPISTWAVYIASLLEQAKAVPEGEGMKMFIQTIPYNIYGWVAAIIVPLVILGIIPVFGPMKAAEKRAQETGELAPPGSAKIDIKGGQQTEITAKPRILNFFLPIIVLIASTIYFDIDMQMGVLTAVGFTFVLYIFQGTMTPEEFFDCCVVGIKHMLFPLLMVILALTFANVNEKIGFLTYVIETAKTFMTPTMLPAVLFVVLGITEFIMGLSWGMYAIAIPIAIPLAISIGANPVVAVGAVCSAGVFGSHICFYSDATILSSAAAGCDNYRHAVTQMTFGFLGAAISLLIFIAIGVLGLA